MVRPCAGLPPRTARDFAETLLVNERRLSASTVMYQRQEGEALPFTCTTLAPPFVESSFTAMNMFVALFLSV